MVTREGRADVDGGPARPNDRTFRLNALSPGTSLVAASLRKVVRARPLVAVSLAAVVGFIFGAKK